MIVFDPALARGKRTPGLRGAYSVADALDRLLSGSDLVARPDGSDGFILSRAAQSAAKIAPRGRPARPSTLPEAEPAVEPEIIVYGARETTVLSETASSVGVVTGKNIADGQIRTTQDVYRRLGNVMDSAFTNSGFVIRGVSSEGFTPAGAPTGSLYVDGILQTRYGARFGARNLWDTEQVEVYRGPQSTLSGRAATAGAIYIKTKDPTFAREFELSGIVGNRDFRGGAFVANLPLVDDRLALRIAGSLQSQRTDVQYPDYQRYNNSHDFETDRSGTIRAKLLLTPSGMPDTRMLLSYSYSDDRPNERLVFENDRFTLEDRRGDGYNLSGFPLDTFAEYRRIKVHNVGFELTHDLSDALRLTSQTGYTHGTTYRLSVDAGEPGVPDGMRGDVVDTLMSQELRLNYEADRWKWVAGVFGSRQKFDSSLSLVSTPFFTTLDETFIRTTDNIALFGEATFAFVPTWHLTLGGRLDYLEESTTEQSNSIFFGAPQTFDNFNRFDETNFVPRIGLAKDIASGHRAGFTYSQGFRTGGFYLDRDTGGNVYYGPEAVRNYEFFYKGRTLGNRLSISASLFYTAYTDQQVEFAPDSTRPSYTITENAASSRSWGFELEPTFQVDRRFSVFASFGYLNTRFRDFRTSAFGDMSGEAFPDAPKVSLAFGGRYHLPRGFFLGGDAKYTSDYTARFGEGVPDRIGSRILINAQAGFRKGPWELTLFAENLLDHKYLTFADRDAASVYGQAGPRRTIGVNAKTKF
ncbi:TonB-dependent receptor [Sphingomonas sp. Leaf357]|nr:TonB-dependent receptor [Sphingomonas sp. Leaf357]